MNFNSLQFLIFFPIVLLVYWLLPHKFRYIWLLFASYYFYLSWNVRLGFLIFITTAVSYFSAIGIEKTDKASLKKFYLTLSCVICLGLLIFFKYANFLIDGVCTIVRLFIPELNSPSLNLILPVGISFYTFQTMSYVIDVYRKDCPAEKNFLRFSLFVTFFPQLVAGPIERAKDLIPQLKSPKKFNGDDMQIGLRILLSGFFRKCVIADFCGRFVDSVFSNLEKANSLAVATAGVLFLVQMYNDFAGYSEIAMGASRMMGIKLSKNFDRPLLSSSFREFFRRWHITLSRWLTDYVYIPLGGSKSGAIRRIINTFIVFAICGLWHGANWNYLLWGLYAAFFMMLETIFYPKLKKVFQKLKINPEGSVTLLLRRIIFLLLCIPNALLFRSVDFSQALLCFCKLFTEWGIGEGYLQNSLSILSMSQIDLIQLFLSIICLYYLWKLSDEKPKRDFTYPLISKQSPLLTDVKELSLYFYAVLAIALGWLILLSQSDTSIFAYFQF